MSLLLFRIEFYNGNMHQNNTAWSTSIGMGEVRGNSSTCTLPTPSFILVNATPSAHVRTRKGCTISPQKVRLQFIVVGL